MPKNSNKSRDAIELLKADHARVKKLLAELKETTPRGLKKRQGLLAAVAPEIKVHALIEEEIFYPAYHEAAESDEERKLFYEATEEHRLVDVVLPELLDEDPSSAEFGAKAKVLHDLIEHHAEEEESQMFPKARKLLGAERLRELGAALRARKQDLGADLELAPQPRKTKSARREAKREAGTQPSEIGQSDPTSTEKHRS
jgi:hemerythrin superfamily protein